MGRTTFVVSLIGLKFKPSQLLNKTVLMVDPKESHKCIKVSPGEPYPKFCPECGHALTLYSLTMTSILPEFESDAELDTDDSVRLKKTIRGIPILDLDDEGVYLYAYKIEIDHNDCLKHLFTPIDNVTLEKYKTQLKSALEGTPLWDESKFGLYTILYDSW